MLPGAGASFTSPTRGMGPPPPSSSGSAGGALLPEMPKVLSDKVRVILRREVLISPMTLCTGQNKNGKKRGTPDQACISAEVPVLAFDTMLRDICARSDGELNWNMLNAGFTHPGGVTKIICSFVVKKT